MRRFVVFPQLLFLISASNVEAENVTLTTESTSGNSLTNSTLYDSASSQNTNSSTYSSLTTSWEHNVTTSSECNLTSTSVELSSEMIETLEELSVVYEALPASVSEMIFPSNSPVHPIHPFNIPWNYPSLPQVVTNGEAQLGLINAPQFQAFVGASESSSKTFPWGGRTAQNTNPYSNPPKTGIVRKYDFTVQRETLSPDGVERSMIVVNGQFPGPTIEANWGDTIEVTVHNNITSPEEGTALHWHGLLQTGTPEEDGVPGITQCPLAPGETYTYSLNADLYGTTWWHAHFSAQYAAGVFGAMVIHGPSNVPYDIDLGPVLVTDYYHDDYYNIVEDVMGSDLSKVAPFSDNNLINGKGTVNCSTVTTGASCTPNAGYSKFQFTSGKSYRLRLINAGAEGLQHFSIDNHSLQVMSYDFVPVKPYTTNVVTLGVGQRADVIVKATGNPSDAVWMRSVITSCSLANQPNAFATVYYQDAITTVKPNSTAWPDSDNEPCANDHLRDTEPFFPITPTPNPATTAEIDINFEVNSTGHLVWTMNNSTFRTCYDDPALFRAQSSPSYDNYTFPSEWNVYDFGSNSSIRIVLHNHTPVGHPMHIHGHNMFVLSEGHGPWQGKVTRPSNPMRRDVQMIRPAVLPSTSSSNSNVSIPATPPAFVPSHMVLQIDADNPGVWPFHCHIAWHVSGGLYVNILEQSEQVRQQTRPAKAKKMCHAWRAFSGEGPVDQIDSGL